MTSPQPPARRSADAERSTGGEHEPSDRQRATEAFEQGRFDEAERLVTAVLAADPDDLRAWYLAARIAGRATDVERTAARLRGLVTAAERTGEDPGGGLGRRLRELASLREAMARVTLPPPLQGAPVVVVEHGAHPLGITELLDRMDPLHVLGERRLEGLRFARGEVEPLRSLTEGGPAEQALAELARARGEAITDALRRALRPRPRDRDGLDLIEAQRFDLVSRQLSHLLVERACTERIDPSRVTGVLVIRGNGRNADLVAATAARRIGSERVFVVDGRLGPVGTPRAIVPHRADDRSPATGPPRPRAGWRSTARDLTTRRRPTRPTRPPRPRPDVDARGGRAVVLAWAVHEATLLPVVRELAARRPVTVLALDDRRTLAPYHRLAAEGLPVTGSLVAATAAAPGSVGEAGPSVPADPHVQAAVAADGPLETASVRDAAWVLGRLGVLDRFVEACRAALAAEPTAVVLSARDRGALERVALMLARSLGIPSLAVQPVLLSANPVYNPLHADHTTAFDHHARQLYLEHLGARPEQVTVTGFARFDPPHGVQLEAPAEADGAAGAGHRHEADPGDGTVLVAMQMFSPEDAERLLLAVASAVGPRTALLVKLHPREPSSRVAHYRTVLAAAGAARVELVTSAPMAEVLARSDLVVSVWSNTLLEAALSGRPALSVNLHDAPLPVPVGELGIAYETRSADEVRRVLPQLLADTPLRAEVVRRQRAYLAANPHLVDEVPAARRIADVAEDLADRGPSGRRRWSR